MRCDFFQTLTLHAYLRICVLSAWTMLCILSWACLCNKLQYFQIVLIIQLLDLNIYPRSVYTQLMHVMRVIPH